MRKLMCKILLLFFIATNLLSLNANAAPLLEAQGAVLMDAKTGEIIYSKNADTKFLPASTTKVMTAIVVLENCKLDEEVTVGKNPPFADGSSLGIREGEVYTVEELLIGLLLTSGNDTAEALAEYVSGSLEEFGKAMTETAHRIGATNTTYTNPSGLDELSQNYTTPHDLAIIMREAIKYPDFVRITKMDSYHYETKPYTDGTERWAVSSTHVMRNWSSWYSPYVISGKTGYTDDANHTFVAAAEKDGQILIGSFLKGVNKNEFYSGVAPLFQYGFDNFKTEQVVKKGEQLGEYVINDKITLPLVADEDYFITKSRSDNTENIVSIDYEAKDISQLNIKEGDALFEGSLLVNGEKIDTIHLLSGASREYNDKIAKKESFDKFLNNKPLVISIVVVILIILALAFLVIRSKKNNAKIRQLRKKYNIKK